MMPSCRISAIASASTSTTGTEISSSRLCLTAVRKIVVVEHEAVRVQLRRAGVAVVARVQRRVAEAHQRVEEDHADEAGGRRDQEVRAEHAPQSLGETAARAVSCA